MSPPPTSTADEARDAILSAADDLFYRRGIAAVTMADIRDRAGVSLRRLYSMYPHKPDLVAAWLESRHTTWITMFTNGIDERLADGAAAGDAIFDSLATWLRATDYRGCGFINTLAETAVVDDRLRGIIRDHKQGLTDVLARFSDHPAALAVLVDGAIVQSSVFSSTAPVVAAQVAAAPLIRR